MAKRIAPRFSRSFRRLCQVAALAGSDRLRRVIDGLLPIIMLWEDTRLYRTANDWVEVAKELFGLPLDENEVDAAFNRAVTAGNLIYSSQHEAYELSVALQDVTRKRVEEAEKLEIEAQSSWLAEVEALVPDIPSDDLWNCLITYAGEIFLHHGHEAVTLLTSETESGDSDDNAEASFTPAESLYKAMRVAKIDSTRRAEVANAISIFFNGTNRERVRYVIELANSTFNLMALGVDEDTRTMLVEHLPALTIFLDTNVIFDVVGAHETPRGAPAVELSEIIAQQGLSSLKLYCHEKTLREAEQTLLSIVDWLRRTNWPSSLSRSILSASPDISSIELKYHQINAVVPTSPEIFFSRYSSIPTLLDQRGIKIYRDQVAGISEFVRKRGELAAEYDAFIQKHAHRQRPYGALDHDMTVWLAAVGRRTPTGKGPLLSGALFLSADVMLRRFEREILMRRDGSGTQVVTQPSSLLQALRPFLSMPVGYDAAFVELFSISSFRALAPELGQTVNKVASYLATFEGLPEEIATNILTNSILMSRLQDVDRNDIEFQRVVSDAVIGESKNILSERDRLLEERQHADENARDVIRELSAITDELQEAELRDSNEVVQQLKRLEDKIAAGLPNVTFNIAGNAYGVQAHGGDQNLSVNFTAALPAVRAFVEEFRTQLDQLPLSPEQLEEVSVDLEVAEAQLDSPKPRPAILRAAVNSLREIALGAAGSGAFAGLVELAQHIHF